MTDVQKSNIDSDALFAYAGEMGISKDRIMLSSVRNDCSWKKAACLEVIIDFVDQRAVIDGEHDSIRTPDWMMWVVREDGEVGLTVTGHLIRSVSGIIPLKHIVEHPMKDVVCRLTSEKLKIGSRKAEMIYDMVQSHSLDAGTFQLYRDYAGDFIELRSSDAPAVWIRVYYDRCGGLALYLCKDDEGVDEMFIYEVSSPGQEKRVDDFFHHFHSIVEEEMGTV